MQIVIDIDSPSPPFVQLIEQIKAAVGGGHLQPGDPLPSIRQLASDLRLGKPPRHVRGQAGPTAQEDRLAAVPDEVGVSVGEAGDRGDGVVSLKPMARVARTIDKHGGLILNWFFTGGALSSASLKIAVRTA